MIIHKFISPIFSKETIVDNEISNNIVDEFNQWNYSLGDIICCGILKGFEGLIYFREPSDNLEDFKKELMKELDKHATLYAFNQSMEKGNFKGFLKKDYDIKEIKAFKGKGWNKQKFFTELIRLKNIKLSIKDDLEDDSSQVMNQYKERNYQLIIDHNQADLIKQALILNYKEWFTYYYADNISDRGWFRE